MTDRSTAGHQGPGGDFMASLRRDHAGLSRVLREIDAQLTQLSEPSERARRVLVDALRYLLRYHHTFHHPREDRLFARIRRRDHALDQTLRGLSHEHETGERQAEELAAELAEIPARDLAGPRGQRLAERIRGYVGHTRIHMREEEAVFYGRAEAVLNATDWEEIMAADDGSQDPMSDLASLRAQYPDLADQLGLPVVHLGMVERTQPISDEMRLQMLALTDLYGGLLHDGLDLARSNLDCLLSVRGPGSLVRAFGQVSRANMRFAGQCLAEPSRWVVNSGAAMVVACLRPYLRGDEPSGDLPEGPAE